MKSALRCGLLAVAVLFSLASVPEPCGQVCETVCESYTVDGTVAVLVDLSSPRYTAAIEDCFADDLKCDRLCLATLDEPCGRSTFHECTATRQPDGRLLVEGDYTLYCTNCTTTCTGMVCAPDSQPMPDTQVDPDAEDGQDAAPDATPESDAGAMPDADIIDGSLPDAAIDAA